MIAAGAVSKANNEGKGNVSTHAPETPNVVGKIVAWQQAVVAFVVVVVAIVIASSKAARKTTERLKKGKHKRQLLLMLKRWNEHSTTDETHSRDRWCAGLPLFDDIARPL